MASAAIMAGGSIIGGVLGGKGAKKAAKAQAKADAAAIAEQQRQFDLTRADLAPWREAGGAAIKSGWDMLQPGYDYTASPGYQWRFNEGQRAIQGSAASKGHLLSGGTLKDLMGYGQGLASQDYGDQFNRTMAVASGGQQAATSTGQFGANSANNISSLLQHQGQAKASGYAGVNQAIQGTLGNLGSIYAMGGFGGGGGGYGSGWQPMSFIGSPVLNLGA